MRRKSKLSRNSKLILSDLCRARRSLPVRQIALRNDIHWKTADINIKKLQKLGLVTCNKTKRRNFCEPSRAVKDICKRKKKCGDLF